MSERIDHVAEALKVAKPLVNDPYTGRETWLAEAQLHATLALVEQQRIANEHARVANLLAATHLVPEGSRRGVDSWGADSDSVLHSRLADEDTWVGLLGPKAYAREVASWGKQGETDV